MAEQVIDNMAPNMGPEKNITCELQYLTTINYALQQNHIPIIKRLLITNEGTENLQQFAITISTNPELAYSWTTTISFLSPGQTIDLGIIDLTLIPTFLTELTERIAGTISVSVVQEGDTLFVTHYPIDILTYDEWSGTRAVPEIIAAFVTPNHPEIERILYQAGEILKSWIGVSSFDGYQSRDIKRVRLQAAAIYCAIQAQRIGYCLPPASFEEQGQKIRTPDRIIEHKLATCLDLTILCVSCLEQAGLHPLIIFTQGHTFPGLWLVQESFSECIQDDLTLLTKRIAPGVQEICVFEATALTEGKTNSFDEAIMLGERNLHDQDKFHFFVDVRRTRIGKIRPIPLRVQGIFSTELSESQSDSSNGIPEMPETVDGPIDLSQVQPENMRTRIDLWERKLLDLSLRNSLLNFRLTSNSIPLLTPDLSQLEDALSDGLDFQIHPRPQDWEASPRDVTVYRQRTSNDPEMHLLREEFAQQRLRADLNEKDLFTRITNLFRNARTNLEEGGVNTLYLALGMLIWYETDSSMKQRYAPIILIPMEIIRRSVQTGYIIRGSDDEPQLNITLLEMLRQDFQIEINGLDLVPLDEHGIDVNKVLTIIRRAIMHKTRWDIIETASLGLFSFSKYIMWHDLKMRSEELKRNKLVASLIDGAHQWTSDGEILEDGKLDDNCHPKEIFCPISADSSQLEAIYAAGQGKSFVLHGPPGTGKSQTITNIIAHALANGKSVLFVAEKMAALTVVQHRLEKIGLAPFCLELHSNKSKKVDILNQLRSALEVGDAIKPQNWQAEAERLLRLRTELNRYVFALHQPRKIGHSIFHGLARLSTVYFAPDVVKFETVQVEEATNEQLQKWNELANQLRIIGEECGHPHGNIWTLSRRQDYSPQLRNHVISALTNLRKVLIHFCETKTNIVNLFNLSHQKFSYRELHIIQILIEQFLAIPATPAAMLRVGDWADTQSTIEEWIQHGRTRDVLRREVYSRFTESVLQLDLDTLLAKLKESSEKWFLPRLIGIRQVMKVLRRVKKPGISLAKEKLETDLLQILQLRAEENTLNMVSDRAREFLGRLWHDGNANWDDIIGACKWISSIRDIAAQLAEGDLVRAEALREHWARLITEYREQFKFDGGLGLQLIEFIKAAKAVIQDYKSFGLLLSFDETLLRDEELLAGWCERTLERVGIWEAHVDDLRAWCNWVRIRQQAIEAGLISLVDSYEKGKLTHEEVELAYKRGFYQTWVEQEISKNTVLSSFSRGLFEDKIKQFQDLDENFSMLIKQEIFARLAARIPRINENTVSNSEIGILQHQLRKQRNHLALRNLFQRIPNVLTRLKPCLLMSPISVAQYLDPAHTSFDLVIFDEASQVPTWEAVGAIARGRETIIVGDPKQLPPTSFFNTSGFDDDDNDNNMFLQDLESILDDCIAMGIPERRLKWHYRSRHESLIAFSNYQYYNKELFTFPSPDDMNSAVKLRSVQGIYDRGKTKQNQAEAEAVVAEILRRLRDPELCQRSIGVVTFSKPQQQLIEDLLDDTLRQYPMFESYFGNEVAEPIFVKNLENVQGDERDVILFSICYGPDSLGRVSMNFGPLNQAGGWRRLNVAVSRARFELIVFSTLQADQIDLSRTNAKGVVDLQAFLEYAGRGKKALYGQPTILPNVENESLFEEQVCKALGERGHIVQLHVGCFGYRIDLAVVDPEHSGRYILGIECDGANYHRAKTARDRDKLREMVLKDLGWKLHRIWSTDWWENPKREISRIEKAISSAKRSMKEDSIVKSQVASALILKEPTVQTSAPLAPPIQKQTGSSENSSNKRRNLYIPCQLPNMNLPAEEFYISASLRLIATQTETVIATEGPVSFNILCRRIANAWGMQRAGNRIQERIQEICEWRHLKLHKYENSTFCWPQALTPEQYKIFRVPGDDELSRRAPEDLPPEEIANAALEILSAQISLLEDDLIREIARIFGYQRIGPNAEKYFQQGITVLIKQSKVRKENNGRIVFLD